MTQEQEIAVTSSSTLLLLSILLKLYMQTINTHARACTYVALHPVDEKQPLPEQQGYPGQQQPAYSQANGEVIA